MYDAAVIGAGPAGCAAAIELARSGARALLLEKSTFPRDKLCGEFLSPEVVNTIDELGCGDTFRAAAPARIEHCLIVTRSGRRLEFRLPEPAWGLSRLRFDNVLAETARAAGAELVESAEVARAGANSVETRDGRRFEARRIILAAGRHSLLQPMPAGGAQWFGFKAHYAGECYRRVELYFFPGGYCGLAPVEGGRVNLCCLVERKLLGQAAADEVLDRVPALRDRVATLHRLEPFLHTGPVAMGWRRSPEGVLAAGDAALFVDPFTGDGMSIALESGRLAAISGDNGDYPGLLRQRFARQIRAARVLRGLASHPLFERVLLPLFPSRHIREAALRVAFHATRKRQ